MTAVIWEEDGLFVSNCPELDIASAGNSPETALDNLKDAIDLWLTNIRGLGILEDFYPVLNLPQHFFSLPQ